MIPRTPFESWGAGIALEGCDGVVEEVSGSVETVESFVFFCAGIFTGFLERQQLFEQRKKR